MKIVDSHCHIASMEHTPRSFIEGSIANMLAALSAQGINVKASKLMALYEDKMQDPLCDDLVAEMADAGISKSILLAADFSYALKDCPLSVEESFQSHRKVMARHPGKLAVFGGVDPRWGKDGIDLFERGLREYGFGGFKVYPPCGFSPSDPGLFPFYEICSQYCVPVLVHIGPTSPVLAFDNTRPFNVDEAARLFPRVNFILAHGAASFTEECAMMCRYRPNVYMDISGYQVAFSYDPEATLVRKTVSQGINHKVLFGTDWPVFRLQGVQRSCVEALTDECGPMFELSEREKALIFHQNIDHLLADGAKVSAARPSTTSNTS